MAVGTTTTIHAVMTALQAQLAALDGLVGVTVASGDLAGDTPREAVLLTNVDDWNQEWGALGNLRVRETYTVEGLIGIIRPGAGETAIQAARARATALVGAIQTYLRSSTIHGDAVDGITLQGTVKRAAFAPRRMTDLLHTDGHLCLVEFGIAIEATLTR